jgi:hypothetical protein
MSDADIKDAATAEIKRRRYPNINQGDIFYNNEGCPVVVLDYINHADVKIKYLDTHGYTTNVSARHLIEGGIKNPYHPSVFGIGYTGHGRHKSWEDGKMTDVRRAWQSMLSRIYYENYKKMNPTYSDCSVCEEWHNFQNFAEWWHNEPNAGKKGFELDKDLICFSNRQYCPEKCSYVPKEINIILSKPRCSDRTLPTGVYKANSKFKAQFSKNGRVKTIGTFVTIQEASDAYCKEKKKQIEEVAEKYKDVLNPIVYNNLKNMEINNEY